VPLLLRSPLHVLMSGSVLIITFTGRKSGKVYSTPVQYLLEDDTLTIFTQRTRKWWRNLRGNAPVEVLLRGKSLKGTATTTTDDEDEASMLTQMAKLYARMPESQRREMAPDMVMIQVWLVA
jgi:deazaflavin-dependent oxidoreductase (nitroreductase family)